MKKYVQAGSNTDDHVWRRVGDIVSRIHQLTDEDSGNLSTPYSFTEEVAPQIRDLLDDADAIVDRQVFKDNHIEGSRKVSASEDYEDDYEPTDQEYAIDRRAEYVYDTLDNLLSVPIAKYEKNANKVERIINKMYELAGQLEEIVPYAYEGVE